MRLSSAPMKGSPSASREINMVNPMETDWRMNNHRQSTRLG